MIEGAHIVVVGGYGRRRSGLPIVGPPFRNGGVLVRQVVMTVPADLRLGISGGRAAAQAETGAAIRGVVDPHAGVVWYQHAAAVLRMTVIAAIEGVETCLGTTVDMAAARADFEGTRTATGMATGTTTGRPGNPFIGPTGIRVHGQVETAVTVLCTATGCPVVLGTRAIRGITVHGDEVVIVIPCQVGTITPGVAACAVFVAASHAHVIATRTLRVVRIRVGVISDLSSTFVPAPAAEVTMTVLADRITRVLSD